MAVVITPGKRSYSLIWNIGDIKQTESDTFFLEGSEWRFFFEIDLNRRQNEEDWKMYLKKIHPEENDHVFLISVYIRDRFKRLECLNFGRSQVRKSGIEQIMWRRKSNVLIKYPDIKLDGDVSFVITILSDHRYITDISNFTDDKSVQTPPYMEIQPCIESLSDDFGRLMEDGPESDLEIRCRDNILHVHKSVLIARSEVFAAMLQSDMLEKNKNFVEIEDMDFSIIEIFVKYLYTGKFPNVDVNTIKKLYETADKYAVNALKTRCSLFLKEHLTFDNACSILVLADTHCDDNLKEHVTSYVIQKDILMYMEDGHSFCSLHPKLAVDVLYQAYKIMKLTLQNAKLN